jgi:hypothetical protein
MKEILIISFLILVTATLKSQTKKTETEHFQVKYEAESEKYVDASLKVLELGKKIADRNGYKLPNKLKFSVIKTDRNVLYFDRKKLNAIVLEYKSLDAFLSPSEGGKNNIYGLCHEIGHLCMHNIVHNKNNWMSYDFRESWADFFGNILVDSVSHYLGTDFWPNQYNFLDFAGTRAMNNRISNKNPKLLKFDASTQFWIDFNSKIGFQKFNEFFEKVKENKVNNPNARKKFLETLVAYIDEEGIEKWYDSYADYLILNK